MGVMYPTTRLILQSLSEGPKTGAELAEVLDDITPGVARTMANLRTRRGLVRNRYAGRGGKALYEITPEGLAALALQRITAPPMARTTSQGGLPKPNNPFPRINQ